MMSELRVDAGLKGAPRLDKDEVNLIDYVAVLWRHGWVIAGLVVVTVLATIGVTVTTPKMYESTVTLLVPKEGGGSGLGGLAVSGLLQQVPGLSIPSLAPNRDMLVSILRSRTVAQAVAERFRLKERYRARYLQDVIKQLQGIDIKVSREGVITIKVEDTDPQFAAEMANFYVEQLERLVAQYGTGAAGRQRVFLTEQLARAKADLEGAEEALRRFQERNRAIALPDQTRGAIEAAARLKGEIMAVEVQLQVMRNFATEENPEMVALRRRMEEMRRQLAQMQYGDGGVLPPGTGRDRRDFTVPFTKVPEVGIELARLTRDVKVQETLSILLAQGVEQVRMAEAKELPVVQVLDVAVPADRHSKPSLRLNLTIAGVISLFVGIILAFFLEYLENLRRRARPA